MNRFAFLLGCFLLLASSFAELKATHIAGAELTYACLTNNTYRIRLKMYRDCLNGAAPFDDPLLLYIFRSSNGSVYDTYEIAAPLNTPEIQPVNWSACVGTPYDFCVEEGTYTIAVNLPPIAGGYDVAWTRCCRNNIITNLQSPECEGISFLAHVPGSDQASGCNSMPTFNNTPSIFLCANEPYYFDYSATDTDGDSLVYSLSHPYGGLNFQGLGTGNNQGFCGTSVPPQLSNTNPMGPPPYLGVQFAAGHTANNPFGPGGYATINPATGFLEAFPANIGVYVMAISVREYRNGVLLSENKRDFQFHVVNCLPQGQPPQITHNLSGLTLNNDTIVIGAGRPFCYDFTVTDPQSPSSIEVTPLSVSFGGNGGFPPPYATIQIQGTTPPVTGQICWQPSCEYVGDLVPMIISARDINDCPNYNVVFDTVWVRVEPPEISPPVVQLQTAGLPVNNDTIVLGVQQNFCFQFMVIDTIGGGSLIGECLLQDTAGTLLNQVQSVTTSISGDTLFGQVCWQTYCNYDRIYMFVVNGIDEYQCPPDNITSDTVYLRVLTPYNPQPVISTDLSPSNSSGDTIFANVNEAFCFNFEVIDTALLAGNGVNFSVEIYNSSGALIINNPVTYSVFGTTDSISGQICWTPRCENVDELLTMIIIGEQTNECQLKNFDRDTIYILVDEPFKPKPLISHDLGPAFPGNEEISVNDDTEFCYTFQLVDTVTPALVQYNIEVFNASGQAYVGALPQLTFTTQSDSLLEGTICWTVPCELADQRFLILMTGRDSFDCRLSNMVFDSVWISHTDNPPSALQFCNASVEEGDASILLNWQANIESDVIAFVVYRQRDDEVGFSVHDSIFNLSDTSYLDQTAVDADAHSYCYQIQAVDRCGNQSILSDQICTVLLSGETNGYTTALNWTAFDGWNGGLLRYDIFRSAPIVNGFGSTFLVSTPTTVLDFIDTEVNKARLCYRIASISDGNGCAERSWSNEICVNFPPTLFVPTAFTPTGDGLNDYFSSFGEFVEYFDMEIYDRWGKLMFRSRNMQQGWDGNVNGQSAAEGVYVFKIEVRGYDGQVLRREGSVTLIR